MSLDQTQVIRIEIQEEPHVFVETTAAYQDSQASLLRWYTSRISIDARTMTWVILSRLPVAMRMRCRANPCQNRRGDE